jgi:hypothetical protein
LRPVAQSGQVTVEYLVVAGALALALFYPVAQQGSVISILVRALMGYFRSQSFVISIL